MRGRWLKKWKRGASKDDWRQAHADWNWTKPVVRVLKFAKKAIKEMKKADPDQDGCGFWYDEHDGYGYREMCRAGGRCYGDQDSGCPYRNLKILIKSLGGECE